MARSAPATSLAITQTVQCVAGSTDAVKRIKQLLPRATPT